MTDWTALENRMNSHELNEAGRTEVAFNRDYAMKWSQFIIYNIPEGRERSIALTKIEEALFWSVAGIARDPKYQIEGE
jgi:hypothetical protein